MICLESCEAEPSVFCCWSNTKNCSMDDDSEEESYSELFHHHDCQRLIFFITVVKRLDLPFSLGVTVGRV